MKVAAILWFPSDTAKRASTLLAPDPTVSVRGPQIRPERSMPTARAPARKPASRSTVAPAPPARPNPVLPSVVIEKLLATAMARGGDFAEVYVERGVLTA